MRLLDLHLGRPLTRGALTIFPIWNGLAVPARGYYDLAGEGLMVAERAGSAVVAELVLTNTGRRPALVLEGELLEGGQQHRVAARTVLVGAGASQVLDVRCVEQGRWSGTAGHARSGRAPLSVRAAEGQAATWERVHRFEQRYGSSATGSLLDATRDAGRAAAQLVAGVHPLAFQSGVLLCLAGQPVQLEAYDSPQTLATVWAALLHAAALDALDLTAVPTPGRRARRFLDRVAQVSVTQQDAGIGIGLQGRSPYARLDALLWRNRAIAITVVNPRHELVAA